MSGVFDFTRCFPSSNSFLTSYARGDNDTFDFEIRQFEQRRGTGAQIEL